MPAPCQCHARQVTLHESAGHRKAKTARHSSLQTVSSLPAVEARPVEQDSHSRVHSSNGASTSDRGSLAERVRADFPILDQQVNNKPLVYLDNAATSQKPLAVRRIMDEYYGPHGCNSNVHRGVHNLAARATAAYEGARAKVARFINARSDREVVWCRNASEGINLVAYTWGLENLKPGDEILSTVAEHHSNLVPWQIVAQKTGAVLRHVPLTQDGQEVDMKAFHEMLSSKTKLVAMVHVSNMLGCILPAAQVAEAAHKVGAKVMLDCCQSVPHMTVDVQQLGADWIVASGHKMVGPTGSAFLWGRQEILESMPPWMGGGEMIQDVFLNRSTYAPPPSRFEAGTPAIAEAIGLGAAVDYLQDIGMHQIHDYEEDIGGYLQQELRRLNGVTVYGPRDGAARAALASFNVEGLHATDISSLLDNEGVAVRSGHHCTQPLHHYLGIAASARASAYLYSTHAEIDSFIAALKESIQFFRDAGM